MRACQSHKVAFLLTRTKDQSFPARPLPCSHSWSGVLTSVSSRLFSPIVCEHLERDDRRRKQGGRARASSDNRVEQKAPLMAQGSAREQANSRGGVHKAQTPVALHQRAAVASVQQYVHLQFQGFGLNMPEIEEYVVEVSVCLRASRASVVMCRAGRSCRQA